MERKIKMIRNMGFMIEAIDETLMGRKAVFAYRETDAGMLHLILGSNGTARILKPNGSVKWYYEKTDGQISAILRQTIAANTYRKGAV